MSLALYIERLDVLLRRSVELALQVAALTTGRPPLDLSGLVADEMQEIAIVVADAQERGLEGGDLAAAVTAAADQILAARNHEASTREES